MTEIPADPLAAAQLAREALGYAAGAQADLAYPTQSQFLAYGELLTDTLSALESLTVVLAGQVARHGDHSVRGDDAEGIENLQRTVRHLTELAEVLHTGALHAHGYWSELGRGTGTAR
jgi:hypothetical protein